MTKIKLITWNINSVRIRLAQVEQVIKNHAPDVICFQETKVQEHIFPRDFFTEQGYIHQAIRGQKSYNGVAIVSKIPFDNEGSIDWCAKGDARHVNVTLQGGVHLHNLYIPAGGDEADVKTNEKFAHKMQFLEELTTWGAALPKDQNHIVVGDFNIAPLEEDVWSHKKLLKVVSHTPIEVEALGKMQAAHDWVDGMRHFVPDSEKLYSWWSYRAKDWAKANKGRRLDHIWTSPALKSGLKSMEVILEARGYEKPSDHAPVLLELEI